MFFTRFNKELEKYFEYWSFENTSVLAKKRNEAFNDDYLVLKKDLTEVSVELEGQCEREKKRKGLEVVREFKSNEKNKDPKTLQAMSQMLHIMLREVMKQMGYVNAGYNLFFEHKIEPKKIPVDEERHYHQQHQQQTIGIWPGYNLSFVETKRGLQLCILLQHRVVSPYTVFEIMQSVCLFVYEFDQQECNKELKTTNKKMPNRGVITLYNYRTYRAIEFDWEKSVASKMSENESKSFEEYYREKQYVRNDQHLSKVKGLLKCQGNKKYEKSKLDEDVYLLPELCYFTGFSFDQSKDHQFMKAMQQAMAPSFEASLPCLKKFTQRLNTEFKKKNIDIIIKGAPIKVPKVVLSQPPITIQVGNQKKLWEQDIDAVDKIDPKYNFVPSSPVMKDLKDFNMLEIH
ncbi:piwi-like protein [Reticulomyxa filosa]|uniref:Piwi-like protein n=1 Tax=Reticulomyxa filosa TaxID=46433 RepID=X6MSC6_RETFI|nr:piwi-like protein [Reticulomyxa filosa]|eukprot:ETO16586.1 piwi-like protein [Reticulomyxa filosa]